MEGVHLGCHVSHCELWVSQRQNGDDNPAWHTSWEYCENQEGVSGRLRSSILKHCFDSGTIKDTGDTCKCLTQPLPPISDIVQVAFDSKEKLSNGSLPQLETRLQRVPADVCDANSKCSVRVGGHLSFV